MDRMYNFNPGPAALPLEVLEQGRDSFVEYGGQGMSLLEMSHRSKPVETMIADTERLLLELLGLQDAGCRALFMAGGASAQFALLAMNFLTAGKTGRYVLTGSFSEKAYEEALTVGAAEAAASGKETGWARLPELGEALADVRASDTAYVHLTTNNTIEGSQLRALPDTGEVPLIADMTSDLLSRRLDWRRLAMFYAGAQKNLGPAGVTVAVIREDLLAASATAKIPAIFRYATYAKNNSLYNTPPVHSIYMTKLMLEWTQRQGGVAAMEARSEKKAALLYGAIDGSGGFYRGIVETPDRSAMNVTWRLPDEALEQAFVQEAKAAGFAGLAGHRSVGGLRASIYNGVPGEACRALAAFMDDFRARRG